MQFLVYEPDLLVRTDIFETLTASFGKLVRSAADLTDVPRLLDTPEAETVVVASVTSNEGQETLPSIADALGETPTVIVGSSPPDWFVPSRKITFLARPFTSEGLVKAVKGVLDDPHSHHQQMP